MKVKDMREFLTDKVDVVPRKNEDVIAMYDEKMGDTTGLEMAVSKESNIEQTGEEYTYVGYGDTPPHMIKFMGIQMFVRGQSVRVTDERVLAKIGTNRSFVKGKADMEEVFKQDEVAAKRAEKQREEDVKTQIMVERANRKG